MTAKTVKADFNEWNDAARRILLDHARRYPMMQLQDVYKLLHQASFACEHAVTTPEAALRRLKDEWATMGEGPSEPLYDVISPDGRIVRVHLRAYAARSAPLDPLFRAFVQTAARHHGDAQLLDRYAACAISLAREMRLPWGADELARFVESCRKKGWPALHHSSKYIEAYCPAYRVVADWRPLL